MAQTVTASDTAALEWAKGVFSYNDSTLVTHTPWARTLRLQGGDAEAYLKILPAGQAALAARTSLVMHHFPNVVPTVLAADAQRGWLLSENHGGTTLDYGADADAMIALLRTDARLQAQAMGKPDLLDALPQVHIDSLGAALLAFLNPSASTASEPAKLDEQDGPVDAAYFLGADRAGRYARLLARRMPLIEAHMAAASMLPRTLSHGDMRPPNAAQLADGRCKIIDWDDAKAAPAGWSLHGIFEGCTLPSIFLSGSDVARASSGLAQSRQIHAFVDELASNGYATTQTLMLALPASMCAGMIDFILHFARFPGDLSRQDVGATIRSRLSDLLDLADWLATRDAALARELAEDYVTQGQGERGRRLLQDQVARHPNDVSTLARFAAACLDGDELDVAAEAYTEAMARAPERADLMAGMADVHLKRLALDDAISLYEQAQAKLSSPPETQARVQEGLDHARALHRMRTQAQDPQCMPTIQYSAKEAAAATPPSEKIALAAELFAAHGAIQIDNALPPDVIQRIQSEFMRCYAPYFHEGDHPDALHLGHKRYMLTVDIDQLAGADALVRSSMIMPIIERLVGDDCVLGAFTAVISLPGSANQRLHKDHPALFPDTAWHYTLPCFAAQVIVPLIPLDEVSGTTRIHKGSHRVATDDAETCPQLDPRVPLGGCLITDYRVAHRGLGNSGNIVRPILTLVYNRPWFRDFKNYAQQPPLRVSDEAYARMPQATRDMVDWWREELKVAALARSQLLS